MLLCNLDDAQPGMIIGASILRPESPDVELLKPGVVLDHGLLARLRSLGISQLWLQDGLAGDLSADAITQMSAAKMAVFHQLKTDMGSLSRQTLGVSQVQSYRQVMMDLVCQLMSNRQFAGMTDSLFAAGPGLFTHSANVAYLAVLVGMSLETYIVSQRRWLPPKQACDMVNLGLAAMLHDIGKAGMGAELSRMGEVHGAPGEADDGAYHEHPTRGYQMLRDSRAAARVTQAVLNHHQRFDGSGWRDAATAAGRTPKAVQAGAEIHTFTRIVSAANVLDNLRSAADGARLPPVAALNEFAGPRFDGWFDPTIRRAMLRAVPPFCVGSDVRLSDGRRAAVILPNLDEPCRPIVRILEGGIAPVQIDHKLDLTDYPDLYISHYLGTDVTGWLYSLAGIRELRMAA